MTFEDMICGRSFNDASEEDKKALNDFHRLESARLALLRLKLQAIVFGGLRKGE